jgi:hypothetical protein
VTDILQSTAGNKIIIKIEIAKRSKKRDEYKIKLTMSRPSNKQFDRK